MGNRTFADGAILKMSGVGLDPAISADEAANRLETTGYFSAVDAFEDDGRLVIAVREKTTWFVIPHFSTGSQSRIYGIVAGKAGLFGEDAHAIGHLQAGTDNREGQILIRDEFFLNSRWAIGASYDFENSLHRVYRGREIRQRLANRFHGGSLQFGYRLHPHLQLGLNTYLEKHNFDEPSGINSAGLQWSHRLFADCGTLYVDEGLTHGWKFRPYFEATNPRSDYQFRKYGVLGQGGVFLAPPFNWILRPQYEAGSPLPFYQLNELGGATLRSFPGQIFRDQSYFSLQNDFLLASVNVWKLVVRPLIYTDWAWIERQGRTGVGTGFQVYFREVAVPAIQVFAGWGFNPYGFSASAAVGPQL